MTAEYTMSEPTHGGDDRPSEGRGVDDLNRPAVKMQEHDRYILTGGCGQPLWKPSILREASLQVSQAMACQEFNSNRIGGCLAPDDRGENRGVPPRYARRNVSKSNFFMILHPAIGRNLRKQPIDFHPSIGSFKREAGKSNIFMILNPAIGNLREQSIDLQPSVGSFKREAESEYL